MQIRDIYYVDIIESCIMGCRKIAPTRQFVHKFKVIYYADISRNGFLLSSLSHSLTQRIAACCRNAGRSSLLCKEPTFCFDP
ncbi:Uncharacterized protein XB15_03090 [Leptospira santarosai]|nr:Uncharacterized protein XB15_03090 [Leptospira santarosai]